MLLHARSVTLAAVVLAACPEGEGETPVGTTATDTTTSTTSSGAPDPDPQGLDSTGGTDLACVDAHHGNQTPGSALSIALGPATTRVSIGDLIVCVEESDFFSFRPPCAGHLGVETRHPPVETPDLRLYDGAGQPIDEVMGSWITPFFLKPMHRHVHAGDYTLEVRHSGGGPQHYDLSVLFLPGPGCAR